MSASCAAVLLRVTGLRTRFPIRSGAGSRATDFVRAVDGIDLSINAAQTLALVGESGSGKTTVGLSVLRLVKPYAGEVWFDGVDLLSLFAVKVLRSLAAYLASLAPSKRHCISSRRSFTIRTGNPALARSHTVFGRFSPISSSTTRNS